MMNRPSRPSSGKLRSGAATSAARLKPRSHNIDDSGDNADAYSHLSREDIIMTVLQLKKQVSVLESERSILKADNRRWEMEYLKQQQRFEKMLDPKFSKNSVAVSEMRREVEKTGLVRQLKQQVNVLRLQITEKDNQFDELKNSIKASYLAEVVAEKEEYYSEVQRLRQLLKDKFASSTIPSNRGGERVNISDRGTSTPGRSRSRPTSASSTSGRQRSSSPYIRMPFQHEDEEVALSGPFSSNQPKQPKSSPMGMSNIPRPSSASKRLSGNAVNDARILQNNRPRSAGARVNAPRGNVMKTNVSAAIDASNMNFDRKARDDRHGMYANNGDGYNEHGRDPRDAYEEYVGMVQQSSGQEEHYQEQGSLVQEQPVDDHTDHFKHHQEGNDIRTKPNKEEVYPDNTAPASTQALNGGIDTLESGMDGGFNDNLPEDDALLSGPAIYADSKKDPALVPIKLTNATPRFKVNDVIEGLYGNGTKYYSGKIHKLYPPTGGESEYSYGIRYDDGDEEQKVPFNRIRLKEKEVPPMENVSNQSRAVAIENNIEIPSEEAPMENVSNQSNGVSIENNIEIPSEEAISSNREPPTSDMDDFGFNTNIRSKPAVYDDLPKRDLNVQEIESRKNKEDEDFMNYLNELSDDENEQTSNSSPIAIRKRINSGNNSPRVNNGNNSNSQLNSVRKEEMHTPVNDTGDYDEDDFDP